MADEHKNIVHPPSILETKPMVCVSCNKHSPVWSDEFGRVTAVNTILRYCPACYDAYTCSPECLEQHLRNPGDVVCPSNQSRANQYGCRVCFKLYQGEVLPTICGGCFRVKYCSKECQRKDWNDHKPFCQRPGMAWIRPVECPCTPCVEIRRDFLNLIRRACHMCGLTDHTEPKPGEDHSARHYPTHCPSCLLLISEMENEVV
jgi:hypothetical protein